MADVEIRDNTDKHRFEAVLDGSVVGFASYRLSPGLITFLHTEVDDEQEGEGIGSTIVRRSLDAVRADGELKVRITCPFYRSYLDRHHEYDDLIAARS
jgi:predicted GNAT family acetyltransferase